MQVIDGKDVETVVTPAGKTVKVPASLRERREWFTLLLNRGWGMPVQAVEVAEPSAESALTGEQIAERVWQRLEQLAQVAPQDRRLQVVASIQGAEAILNAAEPAEVVK